MLLPQVFPIITGSFVKTCEELNMQKGLLKKLKNEKFDIGMTEVFDGCFLGDLIHS